MNLYVSKKQDYFSAVRYEILDLIPKFSRRVLEVGCGSGQTLEMIKNKKLCSETVGIELFEEAADAARCRVDVIHCLDIEKDQLPETIGKFDLILLLDVLEHLVDPWTILKKITDLYLSEGGKIIVSLPNAQHFSLVFPLLFGSFRYTDKGILDKTHLRFFTKSSSTDLLTGALLKIETMKPTSLDIHLNSGKLNAITFGIFANLLTSQYVYLASK
ncbi:class I SAM-dependent methyltransferase [Rhodoferax sp.]|uniref:class I SAM-dependent methyltransferase n=1 Tax=Rhodoferax sp. TaxID=50421 RepID=UPI0026354DF4|nr:class I SAM-dependent methyltransferase [Rhodoferax sp.]MDD2809780.1 class I SAM-dependent methyltransferase [Rhodoferax sp.]